MLDKKIITYLGRTPNFQTEVILRDDGDGVASDRDWETKCHKVCIIFIII